MRRRPNINDGMIVRLCCIVYILSENTLIHFFPQPLLQQTFLTSSHLCLQVFLLFSGGWLWATAPSGGNILSHENHLTTLFSCTSSSPACRVMVLAGVLDRIEPTETRPLDTTSIRKEDSCTSLGIWVLHNLGGSFPLRVHSDSVIL